ncbi:MAG: dihydrodipicolinate synthase family protein [Acidimicrobiia bacterium]|nr:dihydrodipicolinate synthase family protein [Acidimicrobiia bacterium]
MTPLPQLGFVAIAVTPLTDDAAIDYDGLRTLMDFYINCGAVGVTLLGVMGEAHRMTDADALQVVDSTLDAIAGRVPVIVGISDPSMPRAMALADHSMAKGCVGVMLRPLTGLQGDSAVVNYFVDYAVALGPGVPICVQDFPKASGVHISVAAWRDIVERCPSVQMLKHEDEPGLNKLSAIRQAEADGLRRVPILVGTNGIHLVQELDRGADGAMTGFAFPDALVKVIKLHQAGEREAAEDLFDAYLPVNRHELRIGISARKEILRRRGALDSARTRHPVKALTDIDHAELERLLARLEARTGKPIAELEA